MRQANLALGHPCPQAPFGTVIVNHTANSGLGELVCTGANSMSSTGNPTLHGMRNRSHKQLHIDPHVPVGPVLPLAARGPRGLHPADAVHQRGELRDVRFGGFGEYVYGTAIETLVRDGWAQIRIPSAEVFRRSAGLPGSTALVAGVLANETDVLFGWQNGGEGRCPGGCGRVRGRCEAVAGLGELLDLMDDGL
ncbi:uncharacterized protein F4812DRAFT_456112 [Daldinia caldariorum]|uniref:uncharacterized protein n=1 Tax=Daldinia caldariorum TaxID=326644 RepID=UPI002008AF45|nr:uncharacterized protein F4812DRAFT_456112 [Daldinia caldariorum]KAI1472011.1 hypothetical protein F4812DRAFT_456112 [Daldinia caldariorum]